MSDEITLEGKRYIGRFSIQEKMSESDVYIDGEYAARWEKTKRSWWEGRGFVKDKKTGSKERFLFLPEGNTKLDIIPYLEGDETEDESKIDLSLKSLYDQSKESEEILPIVNLEIVVSST